MPRKKCRRQGQAATRDCPPCAGALSQVHATGSGSLRTLLGQTATARPVKSIGTEMTPEMLGSKRRFFGSQRRQETKKIRPARRRAAFSWSHFVLHNVLKRCFSRRFRGSFPIIPRCGTTQEALYFKIFMQKPRPIRTGNVVRLDNPNPNRSHHQTRAQRKRVAAEKGGAAVCIRSDF